MQSYWNINKKQRFKKIEENISTDICIIGGGLTGLTCAYYLSKAGKQAIIIEKDYICDHTSGNTTGKITCQHGLIYKYLTDSKGEDFAKKYLKANEEAILNIESIVKEENIDCDFEKQNAYVFTRQQDEIKKIKDEVKATNNLGQSSKFVENISLPISIKGAIEFENQAQFHPVKYANGLCDVIKKNNNLIFENSKVINIEKKKDLFEITVNGKKVLANKVILATRYPIINVPGYHFLKMYQSISYAIVVDPKEDANTGIYINSEMPTISFRSIKDGTNRFLQIVGYDYKTGKENKNINGHEELFDIARRMYPKCELKYKWETEDSVSLDKIPYIGEFSKLMPNMYVATGYNKWGITSSNVAAKIITDNILGIKNNYEEIFTSKRMEPIKNKEEVKNMLEEASKSIIFTKFTVPQEHINDVERGEGKIVQVQGIKVGVYKDNLGKTYQVKPICTHLGCELNFNQVEKTWDCPCHGSRFNYKGESLETPSVDNLKSFENKE